MGKHFIRRSIASLAVAGAVLAGGAVVSPQSAEAAVSSCGNGRCTLYLSQTETRALANGRVPAPPAALPWQIKSAYWATAQTHRWIAGQYANRGWCSGFRLDIRPWATQGYFGYACNWR